MRRKHTAGFLLLFLICLLPAVSVTKGEGSKSSERAVVKSDSLAVYGKTAATGRARKNLRKGDAVYIDAEVTDSYGMAWCGIREEGEEWISGFVQCEGLERKEPPKPGKWRALPYKEESRPPAQTPQLSPQPPEEPEEPKVPVPKPTGIVPPKTY